MNLAEVGRFTLFVIAAVILVAAISTFLASYSGSGPMLPGMIVTAGFVLGGVAYLLYRVVKRPAVQKSR